MLKKSIALLALFATTAFACEPTCRHGVANAFAGYYGPVIRLAVDDLRAPLVASLHRAVVPEELEQTLPSGPLRLGAEKAVESALDNFITQASGRPLETGIYNVMFSEKTEYQPFKGDCNASPRRLTRNMPRIGESWTMEECEKMDYICGNPPSICYFLDEIKNRIVKNIQKQLKEYSSSSDNAILLRGLANSLRQHVGEVMAEFGAGSAMDDPLTVRLLNAYLSNAVGALDAWLQTDVEKLCKKPQHEAACNGFDPAIKIEILKWP
ncbi:hypothetical protein DFQ28_006476 [Apophysomyces sp. BC1034]|nr:hypothetical protein DFQ30_004297 [Apophysomyces sp. BC1015]KAG0182493.1 hypothetical protein DFQ29_003922 [Apophysomyces sp. BC1021]KAG0193101.1 hypothetical protein DFQ28_006476 [Apophysomyces sp. BC1034]